MRGWGPGRFSFNVAGGRCEACEGQGVRRIEMSFLPDVTVPCDACRGRAVRPRDAGGAVSRALGGRGARDERRRGGGLLRGPPAGAHRALRLLQDVGLGYLTLGQRSPSLSGGEAQRIKLVTELAQASGAVLYVLDEPTVGLHMADVEKLIRVLHRLVDAGNTVVVIEHNLDVIAEADWLIDLGPEGGAAGGRVVASGTPPPWPATRSDRTPRRTWRRFSPGVDGGGRSGEPKASGQKKIGGSRLPPMRTADCRGARSARPSVPPDRHGSGCFGVGDPITKVPLHVGCHHVLRHVPAVHQDRVGARREGHLVLRL